MADSKAENSSLLESEGRYGDAIKQPRAMGTAGWVW